jgi:hypothetical protein
MSSFAEADECLQADDHSQLSACYLLALRSVSIITSMNVLLRPTMIDGFDVLARADTGLPRQSQANPT